MAKKKTGAAKKTASAAKKTAPKKSAASVKKEASKKPVSKKARPSWLDDKTQKPLIEEYARQLDTFIATMADGKVDAGEVKAQEKRLVTLMKEVEPLLDDEQHEKVTKLLCELTAYDLMQVLHAMEASRPRTRFVG